jgi:hypothetical protein
MKADTNLGGLDIIKGAWFDDQVVYLRGKIGETTNFPQRAKSYNTNHFGMLNDMLMIILKFFVCRRFIATSVNIFKK